MIKSKAFLCYKRIEITRGSKLDFFLAKHSNKEGSWGRLALQQGSADFVFLNGAKEILSTQRLTLDQASIDIPPGCWHKLAHVSDDFIATLSFYCPRWRYFNKRYKLPNMHRDLLAMYRNYQLADQSLKVLDIGCGSGRNALFFAKEGHQVTGLDINQTKIASLRSIIEKERLDNFITSVADLNSPLNLSTQAFDLVISTVSLQFLNKDRIPSLLNELSALTTYNGLHFFVFPVSAPNYVLPAGFSYLPESRELYQAYQDAGWAVLEYNEAVGQLNKKDDSGRPIQGMFATLLAQKIR